MDQIIASRLRLTYDKVCIELDVNTKISSYIVVVLKDRSSTSITVDILWLPSRCLACKTFNHSGDNCLATVAKSFKPNTTKVWVPKAKESSTATVFISLNDVPASNQ
ncbi:hypothetical protein REPUB_Repub17cG0092300 [Reevesia pubescens]